MKSSSSEKQTKKYGNIRNPLVCPNCGSINSWHSDSFYKNHAICLDCGEYFRPDGKGYTKEHEKKAVLQYYADIRKMAKGCL